MKSSALQWRKRWVWKIALFLLFLLLLHYSGLARPLENILIRLVQPLQGQLYVAAQAVFLLASKDQNGGQRTEEEWEEMVETRENTIQNLIVENAHLKTIVEEAELLEHQAQFLKERSFQAIPARITSRSSEHLSETMILNRGSHHGVTPGLSVIIENGILIGVIQEVNDYTSELLLMTSDNSRVNALVQNDEQSPGVVIGKHNLSLLMDFIPQTDTVTVGQTVVTSGIDPSLPYGLVIGQIEEIISSPGSLFQQASLRPLFNPSEISVVSILLP